jgi:hypothetical protein
MGDMMIANDIIAKIIDNFDFSYMLTINVLTYLIVKLLDEANGNKQVAVWQKRLVLLVSAIAIAIVYKIANYPNNIVLINSTILAPVFWSWIARPILVKFGLGYKQTKDEDYEYRRSKDRRSGRKH